MVRGRTSSAAKVKLLTRFGISRLHAVPRRLAGLSGKASLSYAQAACPEPPENTVTIWGFLWVCNREHEGPGHELPPPQHRKDR
jgi:hypothetical protein